MLFPLRIKPSSSEEIHSSQTNEAKGIGLDEASHLIIDGCSTSTPVYSTGEVFEEVVQYQVLPTEGLWESPHWVRKLNL